MNRYWNSYIIADMTGVALSVFEGDAATPPLCCMSGGQCRAVARWQLIEDKKLLVIHHWAVGITSFHLVRRLCALTVLVVASIL